MCCPPRLAGLGLLERVPQGGQLLRRLLEERVDQVSDERPAVRSAPEGRSQAVERCSVDRS